MPAKGSCCCAPILKGTMWKLDAATGATVEAFDYTAVGNERSAAVAFDEYYAAEARHTSGNPTDALWTRSVASRDWGPLVHELHNGGPAHLTDLWFVYGGGTSLQPGQPRGYSQGTTSAATIVRDRYDGAVQSHSMLGFLVYAANDYIDMAQYASPLSNAIQLRRYEDDLSTVRVNATLAGGVGIAHVDRPMAFSQAHQRYALYNVTNGLKIIDASDMSTLLGPFAVNGGGFVTTHIYEDGEGGVYAWDSGTPAKIKKYTTSTTPDLNTTLTSNPPTFGGGGNLYLLTGTTLTRINGDDATIEWTSAVFSPAITGNHVLNLVHDGRVFVAAEGGGILCFDEADGTLLWRKTGKGYARLLADGDYIWAAGEYLT